MAIVTGATLRQLGALWPRQSDANNEDLPTGSRRLDLTPRYLLLVACCTALVMVWRATQTYATGVFDFYPLYYGAKAWLLNGNGAILHARFRYNRLSCRRWRGG